MPSVPPILLAFATAVALASCAIAPAGLDRISRSPESGERSLHSLIRSVVESGPDADRALGLVVARWKKEDRPTADVVHGEGDQPTYQVTIQSGSHQGYPIDYFDSITPASEFKVRKIAHYKRSGIGTPLTALRENRLREPLEQFYPPEAITRPVTAVASIDEKQNGNVEVGIQLICPLTSDTTTVDGKPKPLAADFTVPWAAFLSRSGKLNQSRVLDMVRKTPARQPQLYLMEPYDPKKEPLIMIHGLLSTPLAWAELSNDLWADDAIRNRYQIWHYLYNTSAPALYSARVLRSQLRELRQMLDPSGTDPAMQKTTLLTHSMGGIIGKALTASPKDAFWEAAFNVPHESLELSTKDRATLEEAFEWNADPSIHRVIFIAVPHRGSDFADNLVGRLGRMLTGPPQPFRAFYERISEANPGVFTPEYEALGEGRLDSVNALSPRQPTLQILADLPFAHPVKAHSIIGNRGKSVPLAQSSDGIVPYVSSHLASAISERIVPSGHGAFRDPEAVAEVKRILRAAD